MRPNLKHNSSRYYCICQKTHPHFDFVWSACIYQKRLRDLLHQFKYKHFTGLRFLFGIWLKDCVTYHHLDITQFDMLIPIPLSAVRWRERGYNQSELLALELQKKFNININKECLRKIRNTHPHAQLEKKERWTNIQGAFTIKHPELIAGKSILLVDDLLTTGATASEAAKTLKDNGAARVGVFCLAIAP